MTRDEFQKRFLGADPTSSVDDFFMVYHASPREAWVELLAERMHWLVGRAVGPRLLDVGCGSGLGSYLASLKPGIERVDAVDLAPKAIATTLRNLSTVPAGCPIHTHVAWAETLPFEAGTFQTVVAGEVLEHVLDERAAVVEAARVLVPGGTAMISVPIDGSLDGDHIRRFTPAVLRSLIDPLFHTVATTRVRNWWLCHAVRKN